MGVIGVAWIDDVGETRTGKRRSSGEAQEDRERLESVRSTLPDKVEAGRSTQ